jgi:hypothetical protein
MLDLLRLTLGFVGYDFETPSRSIITNPLAYRVLLVDMDVWRFGESQVIVLYYSQFRTFAADSNYRRFNARRLSRMRKCASWWTLPSFVIQADQTRCQQKATGNFEGWRADRRVSPTLLIRIPLIDGEQSLSRPSSITSFVHHICTPQAEDSGNSSEKEEPSVHGYFASTCIGEIRKQISSQHDFGH